MMVVSGGGAGIPLSEQLDEQLGAWISGNLLRTTNMKTPVHGADIKTRMTEQRVPWNTKGQMFNDIFEAKAKAMCPKVTGSFIKGCFKIYGVRLA